MQKKVRSFYIPNIDFWRWDLLTDTYLKVQLGRVQESFTQTELALSALDDRVNELASIVRNEWSKGTPYLRKTVETAYAEVSAERKRVTQCQERLDPIIGRIKSELKGRRINSDRKLPI